MYQVPPEFQAFFRPRILGPGDIDELSPGLWEELSVRKKPSRTRGPRIINGLRMLKDQDPNEEPNSELFSESENILAL